MRIQSVQAYPIRVKARESLLGGTFSYTHFQTVLIKTECEGVEGWGEAMTRFEPEATAAMARFLGRGLVGPEFAGVPQAWNRTWKELRIRGHTRGIGVEALSGIEIALYDSYGKLKRKPVNRLFSANPSGEVGVFAGSLFSSRGPLRAQVERAKGRGMLGAKVKVGFGAEKDLSILSEVRREWPDGMVVADANGAYEGRAALRLARGLAGLDLAWLEEPVLSNDWRGYRMLKGSGVKIGAGESWFAGDFDEPVKERLVQVLEPSVSRCGGIGVEMGLARFAAGKKIGFSPMTGMNSALSLAASIHVASAFPSIAVEFNPFANPLQTDLVEDFPEPAGGRIRVPSGPGLGVNVSARYVRANAA